MPIIVFKSLILILYDRRYYKKQNELIEAFEGFRVENDGVTTISHTHRAVMKRSAILAKVSFAVNLVYGNLKQFS